MSDETAVEETETVRDSIEAVMAEEATEETTEVVENETEVEETEVEEVEEAADEPADEEEVADEEPETEDEPVAAPVSWNAQDKEVFAKLGKDAQEVIARRESERDQGIEKNLEEVRPLREVARKYDGYLKQLNTTPEAAFEWLMGAEHTLRTGTPQQKQAALASIAQDYGISLGQAPAEDVDEDSYVPPQVAQLEEKVAQLEGTFISRQQADQAAQLAQYEQQIIAFKDAKTEAGQPAHPYFSDVEDEMVSLAVADRAAGKAPDLTDLYRRACRLNEQVFDRMQAETNTAQQKKTQAEKAKRATQAKKASKSVSSSSSGSSVSSDNPKDESVRDSIKAAMREAQDAA